MFDWIHSKRRNKLSTRQVNDLVWICATTRLLDSHDVRKDPRNWMATRATDTLGVVLVEGDDAEDVWEEVTSDSELEQVELGAEVPMGGIGEVGNIGVEFIESREEYYGAEDLSVSIEYYE